MCPVSNRYHNCHIDAWFNLRMPQLGEIEPSVRHLIAIHHEIIMFLIRVHELLDIRPISVGNRLAHRQEMTLTILQSQERGKPGLELIAIIHISYTALTFFHL